MSKENGTFEIRDLVWSIQYGNGVVASIDIHMQHPIFVKFDNGNATYTLDGKYNVGNITPSLYHGQNIILSAKEPEYEYQILFKNMDIFVISSYYFTSIEEFIKSYGTDCINPEFYQPSKRLLKGKK